MNWNRLACQRIPHSLAIALALVLGAPLTLAQPDRGGQRLSPDKMEAAWALEAQGVANELKLSKEDAAKLTEAYKASRKSHREAMSKLGDSGGRGPERFEAMRKVNDDERAKLGTALGEFLKEDKAKAALATLGTYSRQWDRLVDTLAGFELGEKKQNKGLALIAAFVVETETARAQAGRGNWDSLRATMEAKKAKLDTDIGALLTDEQAAKWKEATTFRDRRGGGGGGGADRQGGGFDGGTGQGG